ncbi:MAG: methylglutaconyl-CoA hydratase [Bacteroidetes bacterium QH_9_67_14]|nr:MAG: methylglutaconyl-CoA hydratase [Bacteroidetes bacterium QH_9_67_14]
MATLLRRQTRGPTATLTLDRPDKRNALNAALVGDLKDALAETAEDDDVRTVVLTGAGSAFSAGADLASLEALQEASPEENLADSEHLAALFEQIYRHPKPVIAKINGHAIGGGAGLAAVCDFSLIAEEARVGFTEVKIGFVPAIVMVFVRRKLGETAARDLLLRGRLLSGTEAAEVGLVTRAMPEGRLDARAEELADEVATETSPAAVRLTKEALAQTGKARPAVEGGRRTTGGRRRFVGALTFVFEKTAVRGPPSAVLRKRPRSEITTTPAQRRETEASAESSALLN